MNTDIDFNRFLDTSIDNDTNSDDDRGDDDEEVEQDRELLMETLYTNLLDVMPKKWSLRKKKQKLENIVSSISEWTQKHPSEIYAVFLRYPQLLKSQDLPQEVVVEQFNELYDSLPTGGPLKYFLIVELALTLSEDFDGYTVVFSSPTAWNSLKNMDRSEGAKVAQVINFVDTLYADLDLKLAKKCPTIRDYKYIEGDSKYLSIKDMLFHLDKNPVYNDLRLCGIIKNTKKRQLAKLTINSGDTAWMKQKATMAFKSPQDKRLMDRRKQLQILPIIEQDNKYYSEDDFPVSNQIYDTEYEDYFQNVLADPAQYYDLFADENLDLSHEEFGSPKTFLSSLWTANTRPLKQKKKKSKSSFKKSKKIKKKKT